VDQFGAWARRTLHRERPADDQVVGPTATSV
jgi:hypothetical protein